MNIIPRCHSSFSCVLSAEQAFYKAHDANIVILGRVYRYAENKPAKKLLFYPTSIRTTFHNPFLPIVQVFFSQTGSETEIITEARLRTRPQTVISSIILTGLLIEAIVLAVALFFHVPMHLYIFAPLAVSVAVYAISSCAIFILSKNFLRQFCVFFLE